DRQSQGRRAVLLALGQKVTHQVNGERGQRDERGDPQAVAQERCDFGGQVLVGAARGGQAATELVQRAPLGWLEAVGVHVRGGRRLRRQFPADRVGIGHRSPSGRTSLAVGVGDRRLIIVYCTRRGQERRGGLLDTGRASCCNATGS